MEAKLLLSKVVFKYKIAQYMVGDHSSYVIIWVYQYTRTSGRINIENKHNTSWTSWTLWPLYINDITFSGQIVGIKTYSD